MHETRSVPLLRARGLGLKDHDRWRLRDLDLDLKRGEVLGLLGINGAGKSTTLALLSGALAPSAGRVNILGTDLHRNPLLAKKHIGLLPEQAPLYAQLSVDENLEFSARLRGMNRREARFARNRIKTQLDIQDLGQRLCARLSKGQQQRVGLALAMIHYPRVLILDEPTAGLDPHQAQRLRQLIEELSPHCGIIMATHILADVEQLCERVLILDQGRILAEQRLADCPVLRVHLCSAPADRQQILDLPGVTEVRAQGKGWFQIEVQTPAAEFAQTLARQNWRMDALIPASASLETLLGHIISHEQPPA